MHGIRRALRRAPFPPAASICTSSRSGACTLVGASRAARRWQSSGSGSDDDSFKKFRDAAQSIADAVNKDSSSSSSATTASSDEDASSASSGSFEDARSSAVWGLSIIAFGVALLTGNERREVRQDELREHARKVCVSLDVGASKYDPSAPAPPLAPARRRR